MYEKAMQAAKDSIGYGAVTAGTATDAREQRPHERAIYNCHDQLHKLEGLINQSEEVLQPVALAVPPSSDGSNKSVRDCGQPTSDVVNAVDGVAERIYALTSRLASLIARVQV